MTRRVLLAALAVVLVLPGTVSAQLVPMQDRPFSNPLRITPFVGFMTSLIRAEEWTYSGTTPDFASVDSELGSGGVAGLNIDVPLAGRFGLSALGAYARRDETLFTVLETDEIYQIDGSDFFVGRLGVALHLTERVSELVTRRLGASIWAGGVVMHEMPRDDLGGDFLEDLTHFGVNFGFAGEIPFSENRFAISIAAEDNVMFWTESTALAYEYFGQPGEPALTSVNVDPSHAWLFRLGLTFRL